MKKIVLNLSIIATLVFSNLAFSISCPSLSDIQSEGIANAQTITPVWQATYEISQYNTGFNWAFIIGYFENVTPSQAITNGNLVLSAMTAPGVLDLSTGRIICHFDTNQNFIFALAIRDIFQISSMQVKSYLPNVVTS